MKTLYNKHVGVNMYSLHFKGSIEDYMGKENPAEQSGLVKGHTACAGCGHTLFTNLMLKALSSVNRKPIIALGTGCLEVTTTYGLDSHWGTVPVMHNNFPNAASTATGLARSLAVKRAEGLRDNYIVLAMAGDGGTADIGFQALSGAAQRNEDILYICVDNQGYMNTGIQKSGTTPYGIWSTTSPAGPETPGNLMLPKDMPQIMASHNIPYVATATSVYTDDLMVKVRKAAIMKGFRYLHVLSLCPEGWKNPEEHFIILSKLAVETGFFPLYEVETEVESGVRMITLNHAPRVLKPLHEFYKHQARARYLLRDKPRLERAEALVKNSFKLFEPIYKANNLPFAA